MNLNKKLLTYVLAGAVGVGALCGAYFLGKSNAGTTNVTLEKELDELKANEVDAAVTKRVSQQMEQIAYQQKAISDKQRERAEGQSELAIAMRDQAEEKSRVARAAEIRAVDAAKEADKQKTYAQKNLVLAEEQRANALRHQKQAEEQRDEATRAKNISDTLSFKTLAKTLGSSAITQYESKHYDLANPMAYASWYFLNKYKANTYYTECFKALNLCAGGLQHTTIQKKGAIEAIKPFGTDGYIAVSNYGEIEIHQHADKRGTPILQNPLYDFRDVCTDGYTVYALSFHGPLCIVDVTGTKKLITVELPMEDYFKIYQTGSNLLMLVGRNSICYYGLKTGRVSPPQQLDKKLSAMEKKGNKYCMYFQDGSYAEMDNAGKITAKTPLVKGTITAAFYDKKSGCMYLGRPDGNVEIINKHDKIITTLYGHKSRVTDINGIGNILVATAYDKTVEIWNLPMLFIHDTYFLDLLDKTSFDFSNKVENRMQKEWVTAVSYKFDGWPLCVCPVNENEIVIGISNGDLQKMNIMVDNMASNLRASMKRGFTKEEWNQHVGGSVPYIKFK